MPSRTAIGQEEENKVNSHLDLRGIVSSNMEENRGFTRTTSM